MLLRRCLSTASSRAKHSDKKRYKPARLKPGTIPQQRLERILSNRGVGTRSEVMALIKKGRVFVGGERIKKAGVVFPSDINVEVNGKEIVGIPYLALYNKPTGIISSVGDPYGRQTLAQLYLQFPFLKTMHPVGRLDADTSGLLLFSSDGHLTQALLHPSTGIDREYESVVLGAVDRVELQQKLEEGVETSEGVFPANLLHAGPNDKPLDLSLIKGLPLDDRDTQTSSYVRLSVTEGKYRMVRRILHNSGHSVATLHRLRYGAINLGELKEGHVRPCSEEEKQWALSLLVKNSQGSSHTSSK